MELPNPPWYRRWSVILAGVIVLAIGVAAAGVRGFQVANSETTVTTLVSTTTTGAAAAAPTTTTRPLETTVTSSGVLWSGTGSDVGRSPGFRAPSAWHIEWRFDCSNFKKLGAGNFKITGREAFERVQIQVVEVEASGSQTFHGGGWGYLLVDSVCKHWAVTAVAD
jgi:hypothetical protein